MAALNWDDLPDIPKEGYVYHYPRKLDLKPGTETHEKLVTQIRARVKSARSKIQDRYDTWREIDNFVTAYKLMSKEDLETQEEDPRKPVPIVIPMMYSILQTMLSYLVAAFLQRPYFKYEPAGPEDRIRAEMLQRVVDLQCARSGAGLALHTMWRDALTYGFGVLTPVWETEKGWRSTIDEFGDRTRKKDTLFEGNVFRNVDPYQYLPDPNQPVYRPQDAEFAGWMDRTNYVSCMRRESDGDFFNVKYLRHIDGHSRYFRQGRSATGRGDRVDQYTYYEVQSEDMQDTTDCVDLAWMYVDLIPSDKQWSLGDSDRPEKWLFCLAGDEVIVQARPMNLDHNRFPVIVCSPDYDGYEPLPIAEMEVLIGPQRDIDWLIYSRRFNQRDTLNNKFVIDPLKINEDDAADNSPGKFIRLNEEYWGIDGATKDGLTQLATVDITQNNINDAVYLGDMMQRVSGVTDPVQGIMRGGERRSATEAKGVFQGAVSRLERIAKVIGLQAMCPLGYMIASHTQQFMEKDQYLEVTGKLSELMAQIHPGMSPPDRRVVHPADILSNIDVVPLDGTIPTGDSTQLLMQFLSMIMPDPLLRKEWPVENFLRKIAHEAKLGDISDLKPRVMPDAQIAQQLQQGNLQPIQGSGPSGLPPAMGGF